jgi:cell filamentation protein
MGGSGFENDPHSERGSACPKNFFGTTDYERLSRTERIFSIRRQHELERRGVIGSFDLPHLRKIHWHIFRDVFPWAGEFRVVGLAKVGGAPFAAPMHIASALTEVFTKLKAENLLQGLDAAKFSLRAAYYLGEINAIHPFREGNGRTQREFLRQLAQQAGHTISWAGISQAENVAASIASHTSGDNSGLARIVQTAIVDSR